MKPDRVERVFLVRMWREAGSPGAPPWRGFVSDIGLDCKRYVSEPAEIAEFVAIRLAAMDEAGERPE